MTIAGIDFAIGRIGGKFGDEILLGVQDLNISFNGAECLRAFAEKAKKLHASSEDQPFYPVTRVIRPAMHATLPHLRKIMKTDEAAGTQSAAIASIPGRWGMIAVADRHPLLGVERLCELHERMLSQGLILI